MATSRHDVDELHDAFRVFNLQSGLLEQSYRDLQDTVEALTTQLKREQSARLQELLKNEKLGRRFSEILETLPGAILVLDKDGVIRQQNSQASKLLNQPLIGCSWAAIVNREIAAGDGEDGNIELADGSCLNLSRRPLTTGSGEVLLLSDITESRRIAKLRQRDERLTAIGEMTAEFAHQVRTPLASAMLYAGQLDKSDTHQARIAKKIVRGLNELKRMVNDMLGFAAGACADHETVNVKQCLDEVADTVRDQISGASTLCVSVDDPNLTVAVNRDAIKGAMLNLVMNADQASVSGSNILIHGHRYGQNVHLCVTDDGPGIPEDIQPRLFDAFFTTRPQGTGLGLSVVKAVVSAHGGDVSVDTSSLGSSFKLRIPIQRPGPLRVGRGTVERLSPHLLSTHGLSTHGLSPTGSGELKSC